MSPNNLLFLYQTATIRQSFRLAARARPLAAIARGLHSDTGPGYYDKRDVPFDWANSRVRLENPDDSEQKNSTLTPAEAEAFRAIFVDIAKGHMPQARTRYPTFTEAINEGEALKRRRNGGKDASGADGAAGGQESEGENFRQKLLDSLPASLRPAAEMALSVHTRPSGEPGRSHMLQVDDLDQVDWQRHRSRGKARVSECQRIESLLTDCRTDVDLWKTMHQHVFTLPHKLGIVDEVRAQTAIVRFRNNEIKAPRSRKVAPGSMVLGEKDVEEEMARAAALDRSHEEKLAAEAEKNGVAKQKTITDEELATYMLDGAPKVQQKPAEKPAPPMPIDTTALSMEIYGPLFPHLLHVGLTQFESGFAQPSSLAFNILPHVKALGLCSYLLGITTPFITQLARMHWRQFGDAQSALDVLDEIAIAYLNADAEVWNLLAEMQTHVGACADGSAGKVVKAVTRASRRPGVLMARIEDMLEWADKSLQAQGLTS